MKIDIDLNNEKEEKRDVAKRVTDRMKEYNKIRYDKRHKKSILYNEGDYALIRDT